MIILVSACLLGQNCKYNGGNNLRRELAEEMAGHTVIPVCPEVLGGLSVPPHSGGNCGWGGCQPGKQQLFCARIVVPES